MTNHHSLNSFNSFKSLIIGVSLKYPKFSVQIIDTLDFCCYGYIELFFQFMFETLRQIPQMKTFSSYNIEIM